MPGIDFDMFRAEITMRRVLDLLLGFAPNRSLSVNLTKGRCYGFKCNSKGDSLKLRAVVHQIWIYHAVSDPYNVIGREVAWIPQY